MNADLPEGSKEEVAEGRRSEVLDVLGVVTPTPDVFSPAEVAQTEEGLPGDRHHAAPTTDAGQFSHRPFGRYQVLENLETA